MTTVLDVTYPSAQRSVEKLIEARILRPVGDASYGKTYLAKEILDIITDEEDGGMTFEQVVEMVKQFPAEQQEIFIDLMRG